VKAVTWAPFVDSSNWVDSNCEITDVFHPPSKKVERCHGPTSWSRNLDPCYFLVLLIDDIQPSVLPDAIRGKFGGDKFCMRPSFVGG
jgi:hypothetical protein